MTKLRSNKMINLLSNVHLGGVVNECYFTSKKGTGKVEAIDITNTLVIVTKGKVFSGTKDKINFGLGNLELLIKFISSMNETKSIIKYSDDHILIKRADGNRQLKYLLTEPSMIATRIQFEEDKKVNITDKLLSLVTKNAELTSTFIKDFLSYAGMIKQGGVKITYKNDSISFLIGEEETHKITIKLESEVSSENENEDEDSFTIKVNIEHLSKVLANISYDEDEPPVIKIGPDVPTVIQTNDTIWGLYPMTGEDFETEDEDEE